MTTAKQLGSLSHTHGTRVQAQHLDPRGMQDQNTSLGKDTMMQKIHKITANQAHSHSSNAIFNVQNF